MRLPTSPNHTSTWVAPAPLVHVAVLPATGTPVAPLGGFGFDGGSTGQGGPKVTEAVQA